MSEKLIALDTAAFLDSSAAAALDGLPRAELRRFAELFHAACYRDLGKKPALLDGHDFEQLLREILPGRLAPRDRLAAHLPELLDALLRHLRANSVLIHAYEIEQALEKHLPACVAAIADGRNAEAQLAAPSKPVVYGAAKLGRNDPCSCGSGKKYKKCHGSGQPD
jgi:uncharacterized membrane protein